LKKSIQCYRSAEETNVVGLRWSQRHKFIQYSPSV